MKCFQNITHLFYIYVNSRIAVKAVRAVAKVKEAAKGVMEKVDIAKGVKEKEATAK